MKTQHPSYPRIDSNVKKKKAHLLATHIKAYIAVLLFMTSLNSRSQLISTVVGTGTAGFSGDGGAATSAKINLPFAISLDEANNIYICDYENNRIRKITAATGIISTIAGNGTAGYNNDGIAATSAEVNLPEGIAVDATGNIYISDYNNKRIRKITVSTGLISTIAGTGVQGYSGDNAAATSAKINAAQGLALDAAGNVYIADAGNNRIRKITVSTGIITTIAGTGTAGFSGDGAAATAAKLSYPTGLAFDASGNLYIADNSNNRIRKITTATGIITTIAGTGTASYSGDGSAATSATIKYPQEVTFDASGNLYISDAGNSRVRKITIATGIIATVAGNGTAGYNGDGIAPTSAELYDVDGVAFDASGNMYIDDGENNRIRKVTFCTLSTPAISSTNISCYGSGNGTVTVSSTSTGGTSPYTYSLNSGVYQSSASFTDLTPNTYSVVAKDANGCTSSASNSVTITAPAATTASATNAGPYVAGQTIALAATSAGAVTYQWSGQLSYSATGQNANRSGVTTAMAGAYTVTATNASGCTATASTNVIITATAAYTWTGITSTDWTDPTNWTPTPPAGGPDACGIDVAIPATFNNPVIASAIYAGNVQINAGAQLTLNNANLNVCKNWTGGNGANAIVAGSGIVVLNGSSAQTISGSTQMQELQLDNSTGVVMQSASAVDIFTSLDLAEGNFNATSGTLAFKSGTVDSVGIIDNFSPAYSGTLTGNIAAERYYGASLTYDQHFMGSPVNAPSLSQFNATGTAGFVIDPTCDETELAHNSPYGTVFSLHESNGASCGLQEWKVETTGNVQNGLGYSVLVSGTGTITLTGAANLNSSYSVSGLTNSGWSNTTMQHHNESAGWQLVSNPYLATLDLTTAPTGFDNQIQVWNANGPFANTYQPGTVGTDATVAPFQAFMVHKTNVGGTSAYVINATERVRTEHTFYQQNASQLNIVATNTANGILDQTMVAFNPAATDTFDPLYDAAKFPGSLNRHTLYTVNNNMWMSRNVLHDEITADSVPMGFEPGANGTYKLTFNGLNTFNADDYIWLEDKSLNAAYNVRNGDYTFTADSADSRDRFVLHFAPATATGLTGINNADNLNIWSADNMIYVDFSNLPHVNAEIRMYNLLGQEISNDHCSSNGIFQKTVNNVSAAYIIVVVNNNDKVTVKKVCVLNK